MLTQKYEDIKSQRVPLLALKERSLTTLQKTLIVTLAWLMKGVEGQTPDCLDLTQFTDTPRLIAEFEKIMKTQWDKVGELNKQYSDDELLGYIIFNSNDSNSLPLFQLATALLDMQSADSVLVFNGGSGLVLPEMLTNYPDLKVKAVDSDNQLLLIEITTKVLGLKALLYSDNDIEALQPTAERVLAFNPFQFTVKETRIARHQMVADENLLWRAIRCLSQGESSKALVFGNASKETIIQLYQNKQLEAIIELSDSLFYSKRYAFVLSSDNEDVRFVDASDCYTDTGRRKHLSSDSIAEIIKRYHAPDSEYARLVPYPEIAWNSYDINPILYLSTGKNLPSATALGDICKINRGAMLSSKKLDEIASDRPTDFRYVSLKHLLDSGLDVNLPYLQRIDDRQQKYCLKTGQVIVSKMSPFRVCMAIVPDGQTLLASGNLYFLDVDTDKVSPVYLTMFLESELGISQLDRLSKGNAVRTISIADLKQVQIPLLPLSEQHQLAEAYQALERKARDIKAQLDRVISDKHSLITHKLNTMAE